MDRQHFAAFQIFKPDLVEVGAASAFAATGFDAPIASGSPGKRIRRHLVGVIDAARDDRVVRVALEKVDHTSWPTRGMVIQPQFLPAQICETRTQQELFSSFLPTRSQ